ncbi:hypothetical protein O181_008465 [Austropuccinia psidii MF-1]|uniref:Secreted protein n=1 Tax=Austropuccinia psidii MF-1 TaxID=1389203 RepID=A0A9Q3BPZ8_9BASI|nr:hypothetical protein [Austropuccinia psidii MF-1]
MLSSASFIRLVLLFPALATVVFSQGTSQTSKAPKDDHPAKASADGQTLTCTHYTDANTTSAGCNDAPGRICSKGCVGGIVAQNCALKEGDVPSQQNCTIGFGKTSASMTICQNEKGSFVCNATWVGNATCSGCRDTNPIFLGSGNQTESSGAATKDHNGKASTPPPIDSTNVTSAGSGSTTPAGSSSSNPTAGSSNQTPTSAAASLSIGEFGAVLIFCAGALLH